MTGDGSFMGMFYPPDPGNGRPARDGDTGELVPIPDGPYTELAPDSLNQEWETIHPEPPPPDDELGEAWDAFEHQHRLRILDLLATAALRGTDPATVTRRAGCMLAAPAIFAARIHENAMFTTVGSEPPHGYPSGTPMRCNCLTCGRGHIGVCHGIFTLMPGEPDWQVAGREDTTCPACTAAMPPKEVEVAAVHSPGRRRKPAASPPAQAANLARRRARKPPTGAP